MSPPIRWERGFPVPGDALIEGRDGGGLRWFLDGRPVHAGTGLDLLIEVDRQYDPNTDRLVAVDLQWMRVRVEFDHFEGCAYAHLPTAFADLRALVSSTARFRWPGAGTSKRKEKP